MPSVTHPPPSQESSATGAVFDLAQFAPPQLSHAHRNGDLGTRLIDEANLLSWATQLVERWPDIEAEFQRLHLLADARAGA